MLVPIRLNVSSNNTRAELEDIILKWYNKIATRNSSLGETYWIFLLFFYNFPSPSKKFHLLKLVKLKVFSWDKDSLWWKSAARFSFSKMH